MAEIVQKACAGTMESSDVYVEIEPGDGGIRLRLESVVRQQFGAAIQETVQAVLVELGVESAKPAAALVSDLLSRGVVALTAKTKLRLLPPLTIPWPDLKEAVSIIKEALSA